MSDLPTPRILLPSFLAGPIVMVLAVAAAYGSNIPHPFDVSVEALAAFSLATALSVPIGVGPAVVCNAIGSAIMLRLGSISPLLRFPFLWPLVGGAAAWLAVRQLGLGDPWPFAFCGAGAISAMLCRMRLA